MAEGQDSQEIYEVCQKQKDHCQNLIDAETKSGGKINMNYNKIPVFITDKFWLLTIYNIITM